MDKVFHLTELFIYIIFFGVVIYDIIAVIYAAKKGPDNKLGLVTITSIFRKWFKSKPIVPYMIGLIFIGHFGVYEWNNILPIKASLIFFIILAVLSGAWFIVEIIRTKLKKSNSKLYNLLCRVWPVAMIMGIIVGSFWR
jgi:hypothetical protein